MNLYKSHGFLLNRTAHVASEQLEKILIDKFDITLTQWAVLAILWEKEGITALEIQEILKVRTSSASGVLKRMEEKKLILRQVNTIDKREKNVFLTNKGKLLKDVVIHEVKTFNNKMLSQFTTAEKQQFKNFLLQINNSL